MKSRKTNIRALRRTGWRQVAFGIPAHNFKIEMTVHLRFDGSNQTHTLATLFVDGANCGQLRLLNVEAIWLHHILDKGCDVLSHSPDVSGDEIDQLVSKGKIRLNPRVR